MEFVSLGMFIMDEIYFLPPRAPLSGIIGGAGSFAVLGARLFRPPPSSCLVGWVVHKGSDFPEKLAAEIGSWQLRTKFVDTPQRMTTRGLNVYQANGDRSFDYTTQKIQVDPLMLDKDLLCSKSFHLICSPTRCIRVVKDILKRIAEEREEFEGLVPPMAPVFVWEPVPTSCKPQELSKVYEALKYVDVVSPNLMELQALFGNYVDSNKASTEEIASMSNTLLTSGFGNKPCAVIVRLGAEGCFVAQTFRHISMPAYHGNSRRMDGDELKTRENNVVDPTGAGNAFLGGFCVGLFDNSKILGLTDFEVAASYGSVAASFVVEQVGMPKRSYDEFTKAELWNGEGAYDRLVEYVKRLPARTPLTDAQLRKSSLFEKYRAEGMFREEKQLESLENPRGLEY